MTKINTDLIQEDLDNLHSTISTEISDINTYSTTETNTGKTWINGKPIYRIMFTGTISSGDYRTIGSITNLDKIINFGGTIVDSTNNIKYVIGKSGYVDGSGISRIIALGNNIRLDAKSSSYSNMPFEAYIEYTKTTD